MTDPAVWLPTAAGTTPAATAAAEPAEEPPGACVDLCGLRVRAGVSSASSVVTVLPRRDARRIPLRAASGKDGRAMLGREIRGVEDVFHADRHAVQRTDARPGFELLIACSRLGEGIVGIEVRPGLHARLALGNAVETGAHQGLRAQAPLADRLGSFGGAKAGGVGENGAAHVCSNVKVGDRMPRGLQPKAEAIWSRRRLSL